MNLFANIVDNDIDFLLLQMGKPITINNNPTTAIVSYVDGENDNKKFITKSLLQRGDLVNFENRKYLVTNEINGQRYDNYYKGIGRHCNYNIKFDFSGTVKEFPVFIDMQMLGVDVNQYLTTATGKIIVTMQSNIDTQAIKLDMRFIKMNSAWKVIGLDYSKDNLLVLTCNKDIFYTNNDDIENEIADRWLYETKHNYAFSISNKPTISIKQGSTYQVNITATDNGSNYTPVVTYTSSNTDIATIDGSGLISGIGAGTTTITASDSVSGLSDSFSLQVAEISYAMSITNKITNLNVGNTHTLIVSCTADGVEDTSPVLEFVSSDMNIATVDSNGVITAIGAGNVTITVNYHNASDNMDIIVDQQDVITYEITGASSIVWMEQQNYVAHKYINGVDQTGITWNFSIDKTNLATVKVVNNNTCTVTANSDMNMGTVILTATNSADSSEKITKSIQITGF